MKTPMETSGSGSLFSTDIFKNSPAQNSAPSESAPTSESAPILSKTEQDIFDSLDSKQKAELTSVIQGMDLSQPNFTFEYGKEARLGIADASKKSLELTRTRDLGETGKSMTNLLLKLKGIKTPDEARGIFGRVTSLVSQISTKLASAEDNISKARKIMENHQLQLSQDNESLDELYKQNLAYYRALMLYIIAGKMKLDEERKTTLVKLQQKAVTTGDMADIEAFNAFNSRLNQFSTLLNDFESSKLLCLQTAPSIRMAQESNRLIIQKFEYIFITAIPAWYQQFQIAIAQENTKQAAEAANAAIDFTNEVIQKNADMLKQGTIDAAQLANREVIETDTLEYANKRLIEGIEAVFEIHAKAAETAKANSERKAMLEEDLKNELLQLTARPIM